MSEILIVCYSLTGNTRRVATALRDQLHADLLEIEDAEPRKGIVGVLRSVWETLAGRTPEIRVDPCDLAAYRLVVLSTPVWAFRPAPPLVSFLDRHEGDLPEVAFLCTLGGSGAISTFDRLAKITGKPPAATLAITDAHRKAREDTALVRGFGDTLKGYLNSRHAPEEHGERTE